MAKTYKSKSALNAAIKKNGIQEVPHKIITTRSTGETLFYGHFFCLERADVSELKGRGFSAEYDPTGGAE